MAHVSKARRLAYQEKGCTGAFILFQFNWIDEMSSALIVKKK
jgi:hypothetical protein